MVVLNTIKIRLDKQKFIYVYLNILKIKNNNVLSNAEIKDLLYYNFNFECNEDDIKLFFEPTLREDILDLELLMKNLN